MNPEMQLLTMQAAMMAAVLALAAEKGMTSVDPKAVIDFAVKYTATCIFDRTEPDHAALEEFLDSQGKEVN